MAAGGKHPHRGRGRVGLAGAIVDPENPLTARVVVNRVWMHHFGRALVRTPDLHTTVLHLMGLDHEKLTYRCSGRDYRLTDVSGHVIREIMA